jgi:excisionase family DNA binding protein
MATLNANKTGSEALMGSNVAPPLKEERLSYRVPEVCNLTGLSRSKIFQLIASGELPSKLVSGCRIVTRRDLLRLLNGDPGFPPPNAPKRRKPQAVEA